MSISDRKTAVITFRLKPDTVAKWKLLAAEAGVSISDFVRSAVDVAEVTRLPTPSSSTRKRRTYTPIDPALVRQVSAIGNNVNQIARWLHSHNLPGDAVNTIELLLQLRAIEHAVEQLMLSHTTEVDRPCTLNS